MLAGLLALLPELAALAHLLQQLLQLLAQGLLVLPQFAELVRIALLALLPLLALLAPAGRAGRAALLVAPLVLALAEGLVAQVLLLADHVAELVERRHHVVVHVVAALLARPGHLQVLQHLLQLFEQLLRGVLGAGARELLEPVDHALEILRPQHAGILVERAGELLRILAHLLGERLHEIVERRAQFVGQLLDLFVGGAALQRLAQGFLRLRATPPRRRRACRPRWSPP